MDVYVARQPIFKKNMDVFGYELLYRRSTNNFYEGTDDLKSTADVITNTFLVMGFEELTCGTKAFINFSGEMIEKGIPNLLHKEDIIIEILETVDATENIIEECKKLKKMGYIIALDDFIFKEAMLPFIEMADIIKLEFNAIPKNIQEKYIRKYKNKIKFLAEKIETREQFQQAIKMGYEYFQGYFFSKPVIVVGKDLKGLNPNIIAIVTELNRGEPDFDKITRFIEMDIGLSFKMLKLSNSVFFSSTKKFISISDAVVRIGIIELRRWVYLLMFQDVKNPENSELIKVCIIRGKLMEIISLELGLGTVKTYEFFLTGIFSSIDVLLNKPMDEIIEELPLPDEVSAALMDNKNEIREILNQVMNMEIGDWDHWNEIMTSNSKKVIGKDKLMELYFEALAWTREMGLDK